MCISIAIINGAHNWITLAGVRDSGGGPLHPILAGTCAGARKAPAVEDSIASALAPTGRLRASTPINPGRCRD